MKNKRLYIAGIVAVIVLVSAFALGILNLPNETMGRSTQDEFTIFTGTLDNTASISTATLDDDVFVTAAAHGLAVNDVVRFRTEVDSLPAPLLESVDYFIKTATTSTTFEISKTRGGEVLDLTADATGGEKWEQQFDGFQFRVDNYEFVTFSIDVEENPSISIKLVGSIADSAPNWFATQSATNQYDYIYINDVQTSTGIAGDTGIQFTDDDHRIVKVYTEALQWLNWKTQDFASGSMTIKAFGAE